MYVDMCLPLNEYSSHGGRLLPGQLCCLAAFLSPHAPLHAGNTNSGLVCGSVFFFFLRFYLFIFRESGREGEREGEKHQCVVASHAPPSGDLARNPGMCPDWEWTWQPFGSQAHAQSTELHQPG